MGQPPRRPCDLLTAMLMWAGEKARRSLPRRAECAAALSGQTAGEATAGLSFIPKAAWKRRKKNTHYTVFWEKSKGFLIMPI